MKTYKAFAPATISNLCAGFDLLGLALEKWGDEVIVRPREEKGVSISKITGFKSGISKEANSAKRAVESMLESLDRSDQGLQLEINKGYQHSSGLGSSAASAVAAVVAANAVLGKPYKQAIDLYPFALTGERHLDSGLPADNVAASLLGGIILSHPIHPPIRVPYPNGLHLVVYRPESQDILTSSERIGLRPPNTISDTVEQTHHMGSLILGLYQSNWDLIRLGLQDHWIEPQRAQGIDHFLRFKELASQHDALGCSISGSGPSTFAVFMNSISAEAFADEWFHVEHPKSPELRSTTLLVSKINNTGASIC